MNIRSKLNPKVEVSVIAGHFATRHSHNSHYIDITRMKHEHTMAREAAMTLAQRYAYDKGVDTIVCLDGSEVLGAFLARHLTKNDRFAVNSDKNINVITPEYDSNGQLIFRDNLSPMVTGKDVLILISTVNSGKSVRRAVECVQYYGGKVQGIASGFSTLDAVDDIPIYSLFTPEDIPPTPPRTAPCVPRVLKSTPCPTATACPVCNRYFFAAARRTAAFLTLRRIIEYSMMVSIQTISIQRRRGQPWFDLAVFP